MTITSALVDIDVTFLCGLQSLHSRDVIPKSPVGRVWITNSRHGNPSDVT